MLLCRIRRAGWTGAAPLRSGLWTRRHLGRSNLRSRVAGGCHARAPPRPLASNLRYARFPPAPRAKQVQWGRGGQANASRGLYDSENGPGSNERSRRARTACRGPMLPVQTDRIQNPVCHGPWSLMKGSGIGKFGPQAIETDRGAGGSIPSTHP